MKFIYLEKRTIAKINETKSWFFEKINKTGKPLAWLTKQKQERAQINKVRNERERVKTYNMIFGEILQSCYEQSYINK